MMNDLQCEVARMAIKKMMQKGWCDICVVRDVLALTGGVPAQVDLDTLRLLHCVHFTEYSQSMRMEFPGLLKRVLESPSMEVEIKFKPQYRMPELMESGNG